MRINSLLLWLLFYFNDIIFMKVDEFMFEINSEVKKIMNLIESEGFEVYIVGGFVRDSIIGRESNDYDLCTNMPLNKLKELLPYLSMMSQNEVRNTGIIHRGGVDIEITEYRGKDLYEDLSLRDITINSIALTSDGKIIDPMNGVDDIKNKIVRVNPGTIDLDSRAILRAVRFDGLLGYNMDEKSLIEIYENRVLLNNVTSERIRKELLKILMCDNAGDLISRYRDIFFEIIPELKSLVGVDNGDGLDLFEHTMCVVNKTSPNLYLRLAALFHDTGKVNGLDDYSKRSIECFQSFASRLKIDKNTRYNVKKLMFFHDMSLEADKKTMAKFIHEIGVDSLDLLFELKLADIGARNNDIGTSVKEMNNLRETYLKFLETKPVVGIKDLDIDGKSLSQMSFDSKLVGVILYDVLGKVMNEELENKRDVLEEYVSVKYR